MNLSLAQGKFLVLSDLHIGHQASQLQGVEPLASLMEEGRTLIFNGDTFEMRRAADRERSARWIDQLRTMLERARVEAIFIGGNHDPYISEINYLECATSSILITHGDVLFHNIAPWSMNERQYDLAHVTELSRLPEAERRDLASRLGALRRATRSYDIAHAAARPGFLGSVVHFCETSWPPWRPLCILKSWAEVPTRAETFIRDFRPGIRHLLIGHSHYAGIWQRKDLLVINTGSAMCGFRPRCVTIENGQTAVRRLALVDGQMTLGKIIGPTATATQAEDKMRVPLAA